MEIDIVDSEGPIASEIVGLARLKAAFPNSWFAYANREFITGKKRSAEVDVIIVGPDRIFAVDLKDWRGELHADKGRWIQNGVPKGGSASKKVRDNARKIATYLRGRLPAKKVGSVFVEGLVVMTANIDYSSLPDADRDVIMSIDEFCTLADKKGRAALLDPVHRPASDPDLTNFKSEFDLIFRVGSSVKPRKFKPFGFELEAAPITVHRSGLYSEFVGSSETLEKGIVRSWSFSVLPLEVQEATARRELLSREQQVLSYLSLKSEQFETDDVIVKRLLCDDHLELFEYPRGMERVDPYLGKHRQRISIDDRIDKFKALLATVAAMHQANCAHADIGPHSLWLGAGTRHKLSNFASAQYPSEKTLGPLRFLLSNVTTGDGEVSNPQKEDVRALARIGKQLFLEQPETIHQPLIELIHRVADSSDQAGFVNAAEFLTALNVIDKRYAPASDVDATGMLDRIKTAVIPFLIYPPQGIPETRGEEIRYTSEADGQRCMVKIWSSLSSHASADKLYSALGQFLKIAQIKDALHPSFPRILDGGVGPSGAFVAYVVEAGDPLSVQGWDLPDAIALGVELATVLSMAHEEGLSHGDLAPLNLIVRWDEDADSCRKPSIKLVDFVQVNTQPSTVSHTPRYAPVVQCNDPFERDAFALGKICLELLEESCNRTGRVEEAIEELRSELDGGWKNPSVSIARIKAILSATSKPTSLEERLSVPVAMRSVTSLLEPDGDIYYLQFQPAKGQRSAVLWVHGLRESLRFPVDSEFRVHAEHASVLALDADRLAQKRSFISTGQVVKGFLIEIGGGIGTASSRLQEALKIWLESARSRPSKSQSGGGAVPHVIQPGHKLPRDRSEVWKLFAEAEESVRLELTSIDNSHSSGGLTLVPVAKWMPPMNARRATVHTVYRLNRRGEEVETGEVDLERSSKLVLAIRGAELDGYEKGERFVIRNGLDESARAKKVNAAKRLIADKGARPRLLEEFNRLAVRDLDFAIKPRPCRLDDADLAPYKLNPDQRKAVLGAVNGCGLYLLQGPPGTGKTKTIASLVHAVVTKLNSRRVLVASQTHEAVNNAAIRIADVFRDHGTPLDLVRVGDEDDVADELMSVHTAALRRDFVKMLDAEWLQRVTPLGLELGLQQSEIESLVWFQQHVISPIGRAASWGRSQHEVASAEAGRSDILRSAAAEAYKAKTGVVLDDLESVQAVQNAVASWVSRQSESANPSQCLKFVSSIEAITDTASRLRSERADSTFGEFLVKTRAVACGTCVGIGSAAFKLSDKIFDLVIVDEAARCTPAELAVALQSARKVILVGDHKQLQPFVSDGMRKYIERAIGSRNVVPWVASDFQEMFNESDTEANVCSSLWQQYRMVKPISDLVSDLVYGGRLECRKAPEEPWIESVPEIGRSVVTIADTEPLGDEAFDERRGESTSYMNRAEAKAIVDIVEAIIRDPQAMANLHDYVLREDEAPIGIICTYADQVDLISDMFVEHGLESLLSRVIKLGTVDSYQGRENLIVMVSLVRSGPDESIGHVYALERINVALSRAKERLVIVGNNRTWTAHRNSGYLASQAWGYVMSRLDGRSYHRVSVAELGREGEDA